MVREIVVENKSEILIHRYNTRDDTYISYYKPKNLNIIYQNIWRADSDTILYEKKVEAT